MIAKRYDLSAGDLVDIEHPLSYFDKNTGEIRRLSPTRTGIVVEVNDSTCVVLVGEKLEEFFMELWSIKPSEVHGA